MIGRTIAVAVGCVAIGFVAFSQKTLAQTDAAAICGGILANASHNVNLSESSMDYLNTIFDNYCDQSGTTKSSGSDVGLSAVISSIPIGFSLGSSDARTSMKNFCRNYASTANSRSRTYSYQSSVVDKALTTVSDCMKFALTGNYIQHRILNDEAANIILTAASGSEVKIDGLKTSGPVSCSGFEKSGKVIKFNQSTEYQFSGNYVITCARQPNRNPGDSPNGETFEEATVTVSTPLGSYAFLWPRSVRLGNNDARSIQQALSDVQQSIIDENKTIADLNTSMSSFAGPKPTKFCNVVWDGHFNTIFPVPKYFKVNDCLALAQRAANINDPSVHWSVGCSNPSIPSPGKVAWGSGRGGIPQVNICGW